MLNSLFEFHIFVQIGISSKHFLQILYTFVIILFIIAPVLEYVKQVMHFRPVHLHLLARASRKKIYQTS
jgi:hypothetical protein